MELDLKGLLRILRRRWWLLVVIPLAISAGAYVITTQQSPTYETTVTLRVYPAASDPEAFSFGSVEGTRTLLETFRRLLTSRPVLTQVVEDLNLPYSVEELEQRVTSRMIPETQLFTVSVQDSNPRVAAEIANALGDYLPQIVGQPGLESTIAQAASVPDVPIAPRPLIMTLLATAAGILVAFTMMALLEYLDDSVRETANLRSLTGVPLLASIGRIPPMFRRHRRPLVVEALPRSRSAEAIRMLRANVELAIRKQGIKTIMVCSPGEDEGRSTVAANLAAALSHAGLTTVLVDADLRHASQHMLFRANNYVGLAPLLTDPSLDWASGAQETHVPNLTLVASGSDRYSTTTMLSLDRLRERVTEIMDVADVVIFDTPPFLALSDAFVVASSVDCAITVCAVGKTRASALRATTTTLSHSGVSILGAVLNRPLPSWHLRRLVGLLAKSDKDSTVEAGYRPRSASRDAALAATASAGGTNWPDNPFEHTSKGRDR
jgi:polysaccharide biosynthesis transport protein